MSDDQDVTLGEVFRLCQSIERKVETQNGRVNALEKDAVRIKTIWTVAVVAFSVLGDALKHKLGISG